MMTRGALTATRWTAPGTVQVCPCARTPVIHAWCKLPPQGDEASSEAVMGKASVLNKVYPIMIGEARGVAWQVGGGIHRVDSERALDQYSSTPLCWEHALHACTCAAPVAALCVRYDT